MKTRVTLWIEQDNLVVSFDHPFGDDNDYDREIEEYDGDAEGKEATGVLEYMAQSDSWSGLFYDHDHVTRVKIEKVKS